MYTVGYHQREILCILLVQIKFGNKVCFANIHTQWWGVLCVKQYTENYFD